MQDVHGPKTNIGRDVNGPVLSGRFDGPVSVHSRSQLEELNDYLAQTVAAYEAQMYRYLRPPSAPPEQPYKSLYPFDIKDALIFFGRDAASEALHKAVLQDRMTVLHAKSGAGKTSLLKAGLSPRLIREGRLPVYGRAYEDPILAVKRAIAPPSAGLWPELLPKLSLHELLGLACKHLSRETQELVVVLDQFEGFFVFWPAPDDRRRFVEALASCYDDKSLPVRFVIGIRSDYYSPLSTFKARLPQIFHNDYYLNPMTREEAKAAITEPVSKLGREIVYESVLIDTLLDDLARRGVELPHLQIICTELYKTVVKDGVISLKAYEESGRAERILGDYLNRVLNKLSPVRQEIAKEILKELVSSAATKRVLSLNNLKARLAVESGELKDVLDYLLSERLLHRDEDLDGPVYEMAHEYLVEEIGGWIDQNTLEFKQAQELLKREIETWRAHGTLIPKDRLDLLYAHRERFRKLGDETWECLLKSAHQVGFDILDWAQLDPTVSSQPFFAALQEADAETLPAAFRDLGGFLGMELISDLGSDVLEIRWKAIQESGDSGDLRLVVPLLTIFQHKEEEFYIRRDAAKSLAKLGDAEVIRFLIPELKDSKMREATIEAIGYLGNSRGIEHITPFLNDTDKILRRTAAEALGNIGDVSTQEKLVSLLQDPEWDVRLAATRSLGKIYKVREIEELGSTDSSRRLTAIETLKPVKDSRSIDPLIAALKDQDDRVCLAVIRALGESKEPDFIEHIIPFLRNTGKSVFRRVSVVALGNIGGEIALEHINGVLHDSEWEVRLATIRSLGKIQGLQEIIELGSEYAEARLLAVKALGKLSDPRSIDPLVATLKDPDEQVRLAVIEALGEVGDPHAVEYIADFLESSVQNERRGAVTALGKIGGEIALKHVTGALQDPEWDVRLAAIRSVGEIQGLREIVELGSENAEARLAAAKVLGKLSDLRSIDPLIATLKDSDAQVRLAVIEALGEVGDPHAVEYIVGFLESSLHDEREAAVIALGKIGGSTALKYVNSVLQDPEWVVRLAATRSLGAIWDSTELIRLGSHSCNSRRAAVRAIQQRGDLRSVPPLIAALSDPEDKVRKAVMEALGELKDSAAVRPLTRIVEDRGESIELRQAAVSALADTSFKSVAAFIVRLVQDEDEDRRIRLAAIEALGRQEARQSDFEYVKKALLSFLEFPKVAFRRAAMQSLGIILGTPEIYGLGSNDRGERREAAKNCQELNRLCAIEPLVATLLDRDNDIRRESVIALGEIDSPRVIDPLILRLQDGDAGVRREAVAALGKKGRPVATEALVGALKDDKYTVRKEAAIALGNLDDLSLSEPLIEALRDRSAQVSEAAKESLFRLIRLSLEKQDYQIRLEAVNILENVGNQQATKLLIVMLGDRSATVRRKATEAVGKIGDSQALDALISVLKDDESANVRREAAIALGNIGDSKAIEYLRLALEDNAKDSQGNYHIRDAAAKALEKLT